MVFCRDLIYAQDQCSFAKEYCVPEGIFNLYQIHYCNFDGNWGGLILWLILLIILFYILGETADEYLTPSLTIISKRLSCSESLAGVTLLALGNGAADVISSIVAINSQDIEIAIGGQLGAGMFICTCLVGCCILSGSEAKLAVGPLLRDILFYYIALLLLGLTSLLGFFHISFGIIALSLYGFFVILVLIEERNQRKLGETLHRDSIQLRKFSDILIYTMLSNEAEPSTPMQINIYPTEKHHLQEQEMLFFTNHATFNEEEKSIKGCNVTLPSSYLDQTYYSFRNTIAKNLGQ